MEPFLIIPVLILSIVVHEVAHAWQARREGDLTADRLGRITLNPLPHLDLVGSVIVPLVLAFSGTGFLFGWAKPVPVNPTNYRSPVWGDIRVSMAGIVSNLILAVLATIAAGVLLKVEVAMGTLGGATEILGQIAVYGILINLILAFFNLIPIPPLDGSHVFFYLLPRPLALRYRDAGRYGLIILMGIMYFVPGFFDYLMWPVSLFMGVADSLIRLWI